MSTAHTPLSSVDSEHHLLLLIVKLITVTSGVPHALRGRLGSDEIFEGHEEGSGDSSVSSPSEVIVFLEVHVEMLLEGLVSDESHPAD